MQRHDHPLLSTSIGCQRTVSSFHFGVVDPDASKVYIQASLHAEEIPGMLVAHQLKQRLIAAEQDGSLRGSVVLVPVANPIGLSQRLDHKPMGRFEFASSQNFNRHYPDLAHAVASTVAPLLTSDARHNVHTIRQAVGSFIAQWQPTTEIDSLRKTLLGLSYDADVVLDLHCDWEAVMHLYTQDRCWPGLEPLSTLLQARAALLAPSADGFDDCHCSLWSTLHKELATPDRPIPQACLATTLELRGESDVYYHHADQDTQAIWDFLSLRGVVHTAKTVELPAPACHATPLAGSESLCAPHAGLVVFVRHPGDVIRAGEEVAHIIDPVNDITTPIRAQVDGVFYARIKDRYTWAHGEIGRIAGATAFKTGNLLGF